MEYDFRHKNPIYIIMKRLSGFQVHNANVTYERTYGRNKQNRIIVVINIDKKSE